MEEADEPDEQEVDGSSSEEETGDKDSSEDEIDVDQIIDQLGHSDDELPDPGLAPGGLAAVNYEGQLFVAEVVKNQEGVKVGYTRMSYMSIRGSSYCGRRSRTSW